MLSVDLSLIVVFVIIWILLAVLTKIYFNPVRDIMDKRHSQITGDEKAHKDAEEKYEKALEKIEAELKAAQKSSVEIREQFQEEALKEKEKMLTDISSECSAQVKGAREALDQQIEELKKKIEKETEDWAKEIEKKMLK
ncbi:MAG: hypothetical protein GF421_01245 [Candidatus Aminicenantes bacterium]|nr:hypothetical protein [Candidatus Aminicenantes bacterium]